MNINYVLFIYSDLISFFIGIEYCVAYVKKKKKKKESLTYIIFLY